MLNKIKKYLWNILISLDQLVNTIAGGSPDETVSSRIGRNYTGSVAEDVVNFLFWWKTKNHCVEAIEPEDRSKEAIFKKERG